MDPAERMFFAGGGDNTIYQVNLYRKGEERGYVSGVMEDEVMAVGGGGSVADIGDGGLVFRGHK